MFKRFSDKVSAWRSCKRGTPSYSNLCLYYEEGRGLPESWKQKKKNGKKIRKRRQTCVDENDLIKKRKDDVQLCAAYLCHQPEKKNWLDILWRTSWLVPLGVYGNTMIASVSFVLTGNLIYHFPQKGHISTFSLLNMHEQKSNSQRNSERMIIIFPHQSWYYKLIPWIREISDQMSPQAGNCKSPSSQSSLDFRGHLITNFPNVMVLLINIVTCSIAPFNKYQNASFSQAKLRYCISFLYYKR